MARTFSGTVARRGSTTSTAPQFPDLNELARQIPNIGSAFPGIMDVAGDVNDFQQGELIKQLEKLFPTLQPSLKEAGGNILSMLEGIVPADVVKQLQSSSAAKAYGHGVPGSEFAANEFAEALGLTSLDLQQKGLSNLLGTTAGVRSNMTVNPYDIGQNIPTIKDLYNREASQAVADAAEKRRLQDLELAEKYFRMMRGGVGGSPQGATWSGGGGGSSRGATPVAPPMWTVPNFFGSTSGTAPQGGGFQNTWPLSPHGSDGEQGFDFSSLFNSGNEPFGPITPGVPGGDPFNYIPGVTDTDGFDSFIPGLSDLDMGGFDWGSLGL